MKIEATEKYSILEDFAVLPNVSPNGMHSNSDYLQAQCFKAVNLDSHESS